MWPMFTLWPVPSSTQLFHALIVLLLYPTRGNERALGARAIARPTLFQSGRFLYPLR